MMQGSAGVTKEEHRKQSGQMTASAATKMDSGGETVKDRLALASLRLTEAHAFSHTNSRDRSDARGLLSDFCRFFLVLFLCTSSVFCSFFSVIFCTSPSLLLRDASPSRLRISTVTCPTNRG